MTESKQDTKGNVVNNVIQNATSADLVNMWNLLQIWANEILARRR